MRLKESSEITLDDLPKIEKPFFAKSEVEHSFYGLYSTKSIWNLEDKLRKYTTSGDRNYEYALKELLKRVEDGSLLLVHSSERDTFSPVVKRVDGKRVPQEFLGGSVDFNVSWAINHAESEARLDARCREWEKERAQLKGPSIGSFTPSTQQKPVENTNQQSTSPAVAAIVAASIVNSRSESEALGKAGMEQAKSRLGHTTDPRYIDRYHGPDDITKDKNGRLAEWEAKGNNTDSKVVAVDTKGNKQGSSKKNLRRSNVMTKDKSKKIGRNSNRQGGSYTQSEIDLWKDIGGRDGNK